jgi:hypothetical protein
MLSNIWVWDLGSGIGKKPIPDPGSRIQGSKRHRIPDPDPQHWSRGSPSSIIAIFHTSGLLYLPQSEIRAGKLLVDQGTFKKSM